ncbi:PREDICTED: uncharacterized protein LOC101307766 [Fragaria vesca subsp. vesca]|uniref:uncharacterized protein LOC101307766 n=1 Tax=Fragaria vesca subsp. vesca TaxID=101020 RepID=UPI0002C2E11B|nr:PREDICTED: uncharacterized protein LOC101307766 [Fragaria vesca subsp. vesca]
MNAISPNDFMEALENHSGSDSDTNIDDDDAAEYYQPVSAVDSDDEDQHLANDAVVSHSQLLPNGLILNQAQMGVSSIRLNDGVEGENGGSSSSQVEEEDEIGEGADSAIRSAIREDESRRNAPLTPENATRVMEAMRGISFAGVAPDWADRIPEENWMDRLRRLRQSPQS